MRVIAGSARGRTLVSPPKPKAAGRPGVRPTSDMVRGAIFDMLDALGADYTRVLDVYAGTGALGIEALSRGEGTADFVESDGTAAAIITENLRRTQFESRGKVYRLTAESAQRLSGSYTLVLADPPYYDEAALAAVRAIAESPLVEETSVFVLEHHRRQETPATLGPLPLYRERRHGDTVVAIYALEEEVLTLAMFPGRFDPVTNGHRDIVRRAARMFDKVLVAVADLRQNYLFSTDERVALLREALVDMPQVSVTAYSGLTVQFAKEQGATVLVRSMRAVTDFEAEFDMALMNKKMEPGIESIYMMASLEHLFISGTRIREVSALGYDVSDLVPPHVWTALQRKYAERQAR